jgi:hypothetical protein
VLYHIFPKYAHLSNLLTRVRKKEEGFVQRRGGLGGGGQVGAICEIDL